ncbi:MAG: hypothetical protein Kow0032_13760 [Methyloligellaceae bacterium]
MANIAFKGIALAAALALGGVSDPAPAEAHSKAGAVAAGIAIGAIIAGTAAHHHRHHHHPRYRHHHRHYYYYGPVPRYYVPVPPPAAYYPPPPYYSYAPAPWTPEWYAYCASKYRSFDPRTGTYQPYHGPRRLCR